MANFEFSEDLNYTPERNAFGKFAIAALKFMAVSFSVAIVAYFAIVLLYTPEQERKMRQEIRFVHSVIGSIRESEQLLADGVDVVYEKDNAIYQEIFRSQAPNADFFSSFYSAAITDDIIDLKEENPIQFTSEVTAAIVPRTRRIDANLITAMKILEARKDPFKTYPLGHLPLKNYSFARTGASIGLKDSPYYKVPKSHNGLDMVAPVGEVVYATGEGTVTSVTTGKKGPGNSVTITHEGGYTTCYAHLAEIYVKKGAKVKAGSRVGTVGVSGTTFAPHLHYEVCKDDQVIDPTSTFFRDLDKDTYTKLFISSSLTSRSLD